METWRFVLLCLVCLNLPVNLVSGLAIPRCIQGWLDIPDENTIVIKCNNISRTDTVKWTLENEAENQPIFHGFCGSANGNCRSNNNEMYLERRSASETSLNIAKNHWNYGGLRLTCSTKTENASCITNVIHSAELSSCRTEVTTESWQLTVTCNVDNFLSSNKPGRCGVIQRQEGETQPSQNFKTVNCPLVLHNCTNQTNLQIYHKGNCSCTLDLPDVIGNYSYIMKVLPGESQEIAGEVRIDKSETNCMIFMKENPGGSCKCYQRDRESFSTTPATGENSTYVCNFVRSSTSQTGGPTNNTCQNPHPPTSPPIIKGNENGSILIVGENKTLTCTVSGGKPLVSSVIFVCGNKTAKPVFGDDESVSSSVTFDVQVHHHNTSCVCSAIWQRKPELYPDKAYITLYVKDMVTTEGKTEDKTEFLARTTFVSQETNPQDQEGTHTFQSMSSSLDKREHGQSVSVSVIVPVIVAIIVVIAVIVAAVVYVHRKKQNRTEAQVAASNEVEKPRDEFDEQVNMVYVSADTLGIARNSVIIGLRQSRADDSRCLPSPDESSEVTQRRSTPDGETPTALKEHDRKRGSTTSENFYAVVDDNDLA
ncbi:hypothetical protein C0Q70_12842 [Pomacea canaliculata]|uniref:Ig-like domain-containing protein n=1 Tax=Pomacea canaliculata TaxID=400727 RepID=A0A2T7P2L7_POMCA|nr:uncharacterized protein LOC112568133 isoform X2 [Pomacea canaliculata]PVD27675.1 hypothetical protein C0Q70_12842 [Pomacea canaliculata]